MSDNKPEETNGIVTSDDTMESNGRGGSIAKKLLYAALVVPCVATLVGLAVYVYNDSYRQTTAKDTEQVMAKFESTFSGGKTSDGPGSVLPAYQPKNAQYFIRPEAARIFAYKVMPKKVEKTYKKALRVLYRQGLSGRVASKDKVGNTPDMYYENASIRCHLRVQNSENTAVLRVTCANMSAYTDTAKQIQQLYDLYAKNNPDKSKILGISAVSIADSLSKGYKTAEMTVVQDESESGTVNALYYQTPDGAWNYFKATFLEIYCEEYNTPDLKKAFIGKPCYTSAMNYSNVKP